MKRHASLAHHCGRKGHFRILCRGNAPNERSSTMGMEGEMASLPTHLKSTEGW